MIAVDTNVLVYAHRPEAPLHHDAAKAVRELAESGRSWGIPFHALVEFAAVCLAHGVTELWTADWDYSRFVSLRTRNPLSKGS